MYVCDDILVCRRVCMCAMIFQCVGGEFVCVMIWTVFSTRHRRLIMNI